MDPDSDLIRIVFASGNSHLNRALIERTAALRPELPLLVVAEFEPEHGEWIPYHVRRGTAENLAAVRAAIGGQGIEMAAAIVAPGVPLTRLRVIALRIAGRSLTIYDENLAPLAGAGWLKYVRSRIGETANSPRARRWLERLRHPADAEIPLRARAAQIYGLVCSRLRASQPETSVKGVTPLAPGVSVVIPSRNGRELLETLLGGLAPQLQAGEIIVSDNGSSDGTAAWLAARYPSVRVLSARAPLSFARAVNAGIVAAKFSHTLLLNNDMVAEPGFIEALQAPFGAIPDLFCATAQIFFPPGVRREETGKAVWRRESPMDFPVRCDEPIAGEDHTWVLYGSGGCSLFDTEKLRALGGVSEVFDPAYVEDLDFGYRAWKKGWPTVLAAGARVEHRHRATTSRYYTPAQLDHFVELNYLRFLVHAVGSPALFRRLWLEAIRRLQLRAMAGEASALHTLRDVPGVGPQPARSTGHLSEDEILALGNGDVAVFPGLQETKNEPILIASPYLPYPLSHGGAVRMYNLMAQSAGERSQILLAFCDELTAPPPELLAICREVILVRRHGSHYKLATERPDVVEEFASEAFRACLKQTIHRWRPALVQLEFTQMAQYAADCGRAKTLLVEHDITFDLHQQLLATTLAAGTNTGSPLPELHQQLAKWKAFETAAWKKVDCVVTMSSKDEQTVTGAKRVACLPNGVDTERFQPSGEKPQARRLLFIGSFAHLPNLLALDFFLRKVWVLLRREFKLHIIAGNRPDYFLEYYHTQVKIDLTQPGIELDGFVSDVRESYRNAEVVLAPLTASAGTNIKVLEAMAMGRAVVSTRAGVNGLDVTPGRDCLVAESAAEMARQLEDLTEDPAARRIIEQHARETALRYSWREIGRAQASLYASLGD
ncbi:MAG: glycosyltransferase [Acidobacteriota bacterium]|nr:glycosyltransferase [Acidobacteriota bacterium]